MIEIGTTNVSDVYLGTDIIDRIYNGEDLVYSKGPDLRKYILGAFLTKSAALDLDYRVTNEYTNGVQYTHNADTIENATSKYLQRSIYVIANKRIKLDKLIKNAVNQSTNTDAMTVTLHYNNQSSWVVSYTDAERVTVDSSSKLFRTYGGSTYLYKLTSYTVYGGSVDTWNLSNLPNGGYLYTIQNYYHVDDDPSAHQTYYVTTVIHKP